MMSRLLKGALPALLLALLVILILGTLTRPVLAADLSYGGLHNRRLIIGGEIVAGDADRLYEEITHHKPPLWITLNSPGGNVAEAIRMASLIAGLRVSTEVPPNGICGSSCFFLFLAGEPRNAFGVGGPGLVFDDSALWGRVGLHRPFMPKEFFNNVDTSEAVNTQRELMKRVSSYLESQMVPRRLIELMMTRPSTQVYWMTFEDIQTLGEYSPPREEYFVAKCGYDRMARFKTTFLGTAKEAGISSGSTRSMSELSDEAEKAFFKADGCIQDIQLDERYLFLKKLKTGGKPWEAGVAVRSPKKQAKPLDFSSQSEPADASGENAAPRGTKRGNLTPK